MARFELKLPKMGESVAEATITNWLKKVGETIAMDEAVLEIATDKVDSEVPSEVSGTLVEILFNVDDVVQVGQTIAIIETEGGAVATTPEVKAETPAAVEVAKTVEVAKENWIVKWNTTSAIDAFSFPTLQFAVEKKINPYFSVQIESGIQIYEFRKTDTTIVNTNGFKLITEGRFYVFNYLKRNKSSVRKSGGFYTGIQFFYRKNDYNFEQDYFLNETDYENYTNLQTDVFGVKKEVFGANISLGYQIPFKKIIVEPYMYLGTLNRKIKNVNREYNTNFGHFPKDEIHYRGKDLEEESNNTFNFSFGFRIGYKL